jgi:hypothetical protein
MTSWQRTLARRLGMLIAGLLGGAVAYELAAIAACNWLWPESNLCGLPAVLFAFPAGVVGGALLVSRLSRRSRVG